MDKTIRSLYVRVLRGKYDTGRGNPKYMRNIAGELEWFHIHHEIKYILNTDETCPEEIYFGWPSSRMPGCYKWAQQFVVNPSDAVIKDREKEWQLHLHRNRSRKISQFKERLRNFRKRIRGK